MSGPSTIAPYDPWVASSSTASSSLLPFVLAPSPNGVDDTAAINALEDAAGGPVVIGLRATGATSYRLVATGGAGGKALLVKYPRTKILGAHPYVTNAVFVPNANDQAAVEFNRGGGLSLPQCEVVGVSFQSADTTYTKVALRLVDCSETVISRCAVGPIGGWTGNNSIGIQTKGRDYLKLRDMCSIAADRPLVVSKNPNAAYAGADGDHYTIENCELIAAGSNNTITLDDGISWAQLTIKHIGGGGGQNFLKFDSTTDTQASQGLLIQECRYEGWTVTGGRTVHLANVSGISNVKIESLRTGNGFDVDGIYLRNVSFFTAEHFQYTGLGEWFNADSTCSRIEFDQCRIANGATKTTTNLKKVRSDGHRANQPVDVLERWEPNTDESIGSCDLDGGVVDLTNGVAKNIMDLSLPAGSWAGGEIHYSVEATDDTDYQVRVGGMVYAAVNKASVYGVDSTVVFERVPPFTGTLTVTFDQNAGINKTTVRCTATSSLGVTALRIRYRVIHNGRYAATPL